MPTITRSVSEESLATFRVLRFCECNMRSTIANSATRIKRRAYTLLEVVLALAIIMAIAAISWPKLMHWLEDRKLAESAEAVQTSLSKARIWAIDTSLTYQFRFEPNGRHFVVIPYEREFSVTEQSGQATPDPSTSRRMLSGELPEGIEFKSLLATATLEQLANDLLAGLPDAAKLTQVRWSSPVLLYADGTATDSTLLMKDQKENEYRVTLRGLTGSASAKQGGVEEDGL